MHGPTCIFWANLTPCPLWKAPAVARAAPELDLERCIRPLRPGRPLRRRARAAPEARRRTLGARAARTPTPARSARGSVALSRCTAARPVHTRFANILGASISEATMRPNPRSRSTRRSARTATSSGRPLAWCAAFRARSHCRFRDRGTEYVSEHGMEWMRGSTKRRRDRALAEQRPVPPPAPRGAGCCQLRLLLLRRLLLLPAPAAVAA
jgi:hypothetical protein